MLFYAPEELKYTTDFYDYLESDENRTRYSVPLHFLKEKLGEEFSILDINPLKGALIPHLSKNCKYIGLDSSPEAIKYCSKKYPEKYFTSDLDSLCGDDQIFDVLSLSNGYIVRKFRDQNSTQEDTEYVISKLLENNKLRKGGFISINPHFFFRDHPDYSMLVQADFWLKEVHKKTEYLHDKKLVFHAISCQLGIEDFIRSCRQKPDWFLDNPNDDLNNRHAGTYIASAHIIYQY